MSRNFVFFILLGILAGCTGGAVVFVPTALPADVSPTTYIHPSGAFSIVIPRNWSVFEQPNADIAAVSFSPPNSNTPLVRLSVVNTGATIANDAFGGLMLQYQTQIRPDIADYSEQDRLAMSDGSWRISGVRSFQGKPQPLNTFLQKQESLFAVLDVAIPTDAALASEVQTFISTFTLNDTNTLPPAPLTALSNASTSDLEISHVKTWSNPQGVFFITGEVANRGVATYANVPIEARLVGAGGLTLTSATDTLLGHAITPGDYAPFSLRFGGGQPNEATSFEVLLGSRDAALTTTTVITAPILTWTDTQETGEQGQFYLTGTVTNTSTSAINDVRMVATVFDADGNVIGVGIASPETATLTAKASSNWTILVPELGDVPAQYIINAQGLP